MTLAVCSGDVKFYRWSDMEILGYYEAPGGGVVGSISWRCEGKSLLATSDAGDPVLLRAPEGLETTPVDPYDAVDVGGCAVVGACSNLSADLACFGLADGEVLACDLRTKRRLFSVHTRLPGGVRYLQFSPDDTNLAVGARGDIFMLDSKWKPCASLAMPTGSTLTSMAYDEAFLCGASDHGVISTWDPATIDSLVTIKAHEGTVADLTFIGNTLSSVGTDGRFRGYDIRSMTVSHDSRMDAPLSSVAHMDDTYEIAVGSGDGRLAGYDLRNMSLPLRSVIVGDEPVKRIAFPNTEDDFAFFSSDLCAGGTVRRMYSDEMMSASGDFDLGAGNNPKRLETLHGGSKDDDPPMVGSLPSPPPPPSLRRAQSSIVLSGRSEELEELTGLLESTLKNVEEVFEEKLDKVFHGMTVSASKSFIDIEARLKKCWGHVVDFLQAAGEELARKAKEAGNDRNTSNTSTSN